VEQDILQRRITMAATRERIHSLSGDYLEARGLRSAKSSIEIVRGIGSIRAVIDDLARTCAESLDALVPGSGLSEEAVRAAAPVDLDLLARRIRIRSLFQHSACRHRATVQHVERISRAGAEVRSVGVLPSRMQIYDRRCAVLPLDPTPDHASADAGVALIRDPAVLSFLCQVFDHHWERARVFAQEEPASGPEPTGMERDVLLLMAAGKTNDEIAQQLSVSRRSVSRIVAGLMEHLGAGNRFQAGVRAAQRGWLS
jgi:DNA-binding CsgD family transcriptional regulator